MELVVRHVATASDGRHRRWEQPVTAEAVAGGE